MSKKTSGGGAAKSGKKTVVENKRASKDSVGMGKRSYAPTPPKRPSGSSGDKKK